jgi:Family of unknown function (DUF5906)
MSVSQFDRDDLTIAKIAQAGLKGQQAAHNQFLNHRGTRRVRAITYSPGEPAITHEELNGQTVDCVNKWRASSLNPIEGDAAPWLDHVTMLTEPEGPEAREHLLNWMAYKVQKRGGKINHAIMLYSREQGTGKDTAVEPLLKIIGAHNVEKVGENDLRSDFNGWAQKELLVVKEVAKLASADIERIKGNLAATPGDMVRVNEKNVKPFNIPNRQNVILFSNNKDALEIPDTDRRFWICHCVEEAQPEEYFKTLYDWYENQGGYGKVFAYLLARDISGFNPMAKPPMTNAKREMINLARPEHERWLDEQFAEEGKFAWRTIMTVAEIKEDWDAPHGLNGRNVPAALQKVGFERGPEVKLDGKAVQMWLRGRPLLAKDSPKTLKEMLTTERAKTAADTAASEAASGW